ncbi:MAG: hypothetical protein JWN90_388 [Parcubacteria group bacterium]|nr:hypothetical protein [Parcubacteria group bacterium]
MEFVTGSLRPVRVAFVCENHSSCPSEVSAAFKAVGATMVANPESADVILFGICACCPHGLAKLGELFTNLRDGNKGPTKGRGLVLFQVGDPRRRTSLFGILDHPTPEELVAAAWEVRPPTHQGD